MSNLKTQSINDEIFDVVFCFSSRTEENNIDFIYFLRSFMLLIIDLRVFLLVFFVIIFMIYYKSVYLICYWEWEVAPYGNLPRSGKILFRRSLFPSGLSTCRIHSLIFWWGRRCRRQDEIVFLFRDKSEEIHWHRFSIIDC